MRRPAGRLAVTLSRVIETPPPSGPGRSAQHLLQLEPAVARTRDPAAGGEPVRLRDGWLNPIGLDPDELAKRTLTDLYNARPTWLEHAQATLGRAVLAAYGWPADLVDSEILACLLALNPEREP